MLLLSDIVADQAADIQKVTKCWQENKKKYLLYILVAWTFLTR